MARAFQQRMLCELDCLSEQDLQGKLKLLSREMADVKAKPDKLSKKGKQVEEPSEPLWLEPFSNAF